MSTAVPTPEPSPELTAEPPRDLTPLLVRHTRNGWLGAARVVALIGAAITVMVVALAIGMRLDDAEIDRNPGTATATVLSVSPLRTGIEFVEAGGLTVRPTSGVLYPGLLSVGQQFLVEYSTREPTVVRVAGRTAAVGTLPLVATLLGTAAVAGPAVWLLRRRAGRPLWVAPARPAELSS